MRAEWRASLMAAPRAVNWVYWRAALKGPC